MGASAGAGLERALRLRRRRRLLLLVVIRHHHGPKCRSRRRFRQAPERVRSALHRLRRCGVSSGTIGVSSSFVSLTEITTVSVLSSSTGAGAGTGFTSVISSLSRADLRQLLRLGVGASAASSSRADLRYGDVRRVRNTGASAGPASSWFDVGADDRFCLKIK